MSRPARVAFLYEDDDLIAVDKPEGLPTIAPEGRRVRSLYDIVSDHIRKRNPKGRAAVVHRLDRDSSGIMVFAKNAATKARLMGSWNELVAKRRYVAVVDGLLPQNEGILDSWLSEVGPGRMREALNQSKGALRAVTHYRVLATGPVHSLVELSLETGRKHQIRVQLAGIGCPVSGDDKYGSRTDPLGRLCLHASLLEITSMPGKPPLILESPVPPGFAKAVKTLASKNGGTSTARYSSDPKPGRSRHGRNRGGLPEARPGGSASNSYRGEQPGGHGPRPGDRLGNRPGFPKTRG